MVGKLPGLFVALLPAMQTLEAMKTGRISKYSTFFYVRSTACRASAATLAAFLQFPAFFSCTPTPAVAENHQEKQIYIQCTKNPTAKALDLFFFDTLGVQALDAYQQIPAFQPGEPVYGLCSAGPKRLVALSGTAGVTNPWLWVNNYGNLCKHSFSLERDSAQSPLLAGEILLEDGASRQAFLPLQPMLAAVRIRSVSCDFSGRPYAGHPFLNNKLFLTYAGSECRPLGPGGGGAVSWLNPGEVDSTAVMRLPAPEMVLQEGCGPVDTAGKLIDRSFYCYPHPDTRLVLEGMVDTVHCYYPIPLPQLESGRCLQLDITLRRMGSPHPDMPVSSGMVVLRTAILPWEEWPPYSVSF